MIERRNDPRVIPYLAPSRQFCDKVIMKSGVTTSQRERFVFTHGDLNEGNIIVTKNSAGRYTITGLLDFEWAMSAPEEIEFHRGFRWIKQADPVLREVYWRRLWSELEARGGKCQRIQKDFCDPPFNTNVYSICLQCTNLHAMKSARTYVLLSG